LLGGQRDDDDREFTALALVNRDRIRQRHLVQFPKIIGDVTLVEADDDFLLKAAAERQGALAGYRLADEIRKHLKFSGIVPPLPD
jgi:hypothetical protein